MLQGSSDREESIENKLPFNGQVDFTSHGCPCGWLIQCFPCDLKTILSLYTKYMYIYFVTFQPLCKLINNKMYTCMSFVFIIQVWWVKRKILLLSNKDIKSFVIWTKIKFFLGGCYMLSSYFTLYHLECKQSEQY